MAATRNRSSLLPRLVAWAEEAENEDGDEPAAPGQMSFTRTVPASVPSLAQSSFEVAPSASRISSARFTGIPYFAATCSAATAVRPKPGV